MLQQLDPQIPSTIRGTVRHNALVILHTYRTCGKKCVATKLESDLKLILASLLERCVPPGYYSGAGLAGRYDFSPMHELQYVHHVVCDSNGFGREHHWKVVA